MKEGLVNGKRAVVTHHQSAEVAEPSEGTFHDPPPLIATQRPSVLGRGFASILAMRGDQLDVALAQLPTQWITIVAAVANEPFGLLPGTPGLMPPAYPDRLQRRLDEFDLRRGSRVKVVSQRKTLAVDHHHPLRSLAPLGLADGRAPFLAGAKLPSRKDSLHFNCWRSFNSPRKARQISSHTSCSSQSRSLRQQVVGEGNSSGKSCQRAPLRKIHKISSRTLRSGAGGRPPRGRDGRRGSNGRIFSPLGVGQPPTVSRHRPSLWRQLLSPASPRKNNYLNSNPLYRVLKWLLLVIESHFSAPGLSRLAREAQEIHRTGS